MRLRYQLFLTLLLSSATLIAIMYAFNAWSFNRGFTDYLIDNEKQRLKPTLAALADAYQQKGSWDWLVNDKRELQNFLEPERRDRKRRDPPRKKNKQSGPGRSNTKFQLADKDLTLLIGSDSQRSRVIWQNIIVNEDTVGYLGFREPRGLPGDLEQVFASQQLRGFAYSAVAMIVLSGLIAIALASRIVKPILKVNNAVGHITGGDYQQRIENTSRDEVGDLSRNINHLARTLETNLQARQQWMAEISHELRTPVAVLQGEIEAIQDGVNPLDQAAIDSLHSETTRLGRLINDLHELTLSDMAALNYQMRSLDLLELIESRLHSAKALTDQQQLAVQISGKPANINGDAQRLSQLIDNLIQNSIRYTDTGGTIEVSLKPAADNPDELVLEWADSSPGVSDDQLPRLFDPLYRGEDSRSREYGGSGLGLAIVEKIVSAHQGELEAFQSALGGLGIRVRLPIL